MNDANMCVPTSFFYTLKTAYEMRMSDWSSDVCSSDLAGSVAIAINLSNIYPTESPGGWHLLGRTPVEQFDLGRDPPILLSAGDRRSEEHTSELQSLMRISYAVFCLKKTKRCNYSRDTKRRITHIQRLLTETQRN